VVFESSNEVMCIWVFETDRDMPSTGARMISGLEVEVFQVLRECNWRRGSGLVSDLAFEDRQEP